MLHSGTDPGSYITEHTLVYEDYWVAGLNLHQERNWRKAWTLSTIHKPSP